MIETAADYSRLRMAQTQVQSSEAWPAFADRGPSAQDRLEGDELVGALRVAIDEALTPHERSVFVALALGQVPIDVLAERLGTTRGALYKTLHDARRKLRGVLAAGGYVESAILQERR